MKHNGIFTCLLFFLLSFMMTARPVHDVVLALSQPDGSIFRAVFKGDEHLRIKTDPKGHSIIQDKDGWWCYAVYMDDGRKVSSGYRVGEEVPSDILARSRNIPYALLNDAAGRSRKMTADEIPLLERMRRREDIQVRSEGDGQQVMVKHGLVILAQFPDLSFTYTKQDFENLLNHDGYSLNGAMGCAKEYFDSQFHGKFEFDFKVTDIVTLPRNLAYYGANTSDSGVLESDKAPEDMVIDACTLVDPDVDFSLYDDDGDGVVDNVFVFFAGGDEAEGAGDDCIWSHAWYVFNGAGKKLVLDGKRIDRYACASELTRYLASDNKIRQRMTGIGTFCHEYCHTFGLPDLYDTDYDASGGESDALWVSTSIMDGGNYNGSGNCPPFFNAIERELLMLSEPELIETDGTYVLEPINESGRFYRMNTDTEGEYYLFECRSNEGWDKYIGGRGLLVYHIDKSTRDAGFSDSYDGNLTAYRRWEYCNEVNCRPDHQCADLVEAFPNASNVRNVFFPVSSVNSLEASRMPYWSGMCGGLSLSGIHMDGNSVVFTVLGSSAETTPPEPVKMNFEKFQDAAIVTFESNIPFDGDASVIWGQTGKETKTETLAPYQRGKYALVLEGLTPRTSYTVNVSFSVGTVFGKDSSISFMTSSDLGGLPYIYLRNVMRNSDGSFAKGAALPLRVYNAVGAACVEWTYDSLSVRVDESCYFTLNESGVLKAVVTWEDGSCSVLQKEIIVKK